MDQLTHQDAGRTTQAYHERTTNRAVNKTHNTVLLEGVMKEIKEEKSFHVRQKQLIGLDKLMELDINTLASEMSRLEDSIERLIRSNEEMLEFERESEQDVESLQVLKQARDENLETIACQKERVEMIKWAIQKKLPRPSGSDNSHYNQSYVPQTNVKMVLSHEPTANHSSASRLGQMVELNSDNGISL